MNMMKAFPIFQLSFVSLFMMNFAIQDGTQTVFLQRTVNLCRFDRVFQGDKLQCARNCAKRLGCLAIEETKKCQLLKHCGIKGAPVKVEGYVKCGDKTTKLVSNSCYRLVTKSWMMANADDGCYAGILAQPTTRESALQLHRFALEEASSCKYEDEKGFKRFCIGLQNPTMKPVAVTTGDGNELRYKYSDFWLPKLDKYHFKANPSEEKYTAMLLIIVEKTVWWVDASPNSRCCPICLI